LIELRWGIQPIIRVSVKYRDWWAELKRYGAKGRSKRGLPHWYRPELKQQRIALDLDQQRRFRAFGRVEPLEIDPGKAETVKPAQDETAPDLIIDISSGLSLELSAS